MGSPLRPGVQPLLFAQHVNSNVQPIPGWAAMGDLWNLGNHW